MKGVFGYLFVHSGLSFFKDWEGSKSAVSAVSVSLKSYVFIVVANTVMFVGWALYNQLVFGRRNRRRVAAPIETKEIGAFFGLSADQVRACQTTREIAMRHDRSGVLVECDACPELGNTATELPT